MSEHRFSLGKLILLVILFSAGVVAYQFIKAPVKAPQTQFRLIDNQLVSIADLQGKVVVLNFWSTECMACVKEMPTLAKIYHDYQMRGFDLLAVALNMDDVGKVVRFARVNVLPFKVAYDASGEAVQSWGPITVIPTTFILDRQGRVVKVINKMLTYDQLSSVIQKYL